MGLNFSKLISDRVALNLSPKFYITIKQDHEPYSPPLGPISEPFYENLIDDLFTFNLSIGIEYLFKNLNNDICLATSMLPNKIIL